ncbi:MAG: hypothetical protein M1834_007277 [Cirrosporium novae-zelandiae]|nr:MAG: hypothetical protein M1834_007277 [Cirrosporium novae-zelandiae]
MSYQFSTFVGQPDGSLKKGVSSRGPLVGNQILLKMTHSGICGTDIVFKKAGICLGHEGVGIVEAIGSNVTNFKVGERAGFGWVHTSCGSCNECLSAQEPFCEKNTVFGSSDQDIGSLATGVVWDEKFLFHIPEAMASEYAAPLMCAGATVYSCFKEYNIRETDTVGVIGIGGLGHLALQFADKLGCQVVAFSRTDNKKTEAMSFGATKFAATADGADLQKQLGDTRINHLIVTTEVQPNWEQYIPVLAPRASIYPLTVELGTTFNIPYLPIIVKGLHIQGSAVASRAVHTQMLEFAARKGIKPQIMKFPYTLEGVEKAFETLESGKMRYRGVIEF